MVKYALISMTSAVADGKVTNWGFNFTISNRFCPRDKTVTKLMVKP